MDLRYPDLEHKSLQGYRLQNPWMKPADSHAWAYTAEALVVTGLGLDDASRDRHIWFFEHDCDWAGNIRSLLAAYADDAADLIAAELRPKMRSASNPAREVLTEWMWYNCATPAFLDRYAAHRACAMVRWHNHGVAMLTCGCGMRRL